MASEVWRGGSNLAPTTYQTDFICKASASARSEPKHQQEAQSIDSYSLKNSGKVECNSICDVYYATNFSPAGCFAISGAEKY